MKRVNNTDNRRFKRNLLRLEKRSITVFLDIDGVLNRYPERDSLGEYLVEYNAYTKLFDKKYKIDWMSPSCLKYFKEYVDKMRLSGVDVKCILSSSWRVIFPLSRINKALEDHGFGKNFIMDKTVYYLRTRGEEIDNSVEDYDIKHYVIIDDEPCHIHQTDRILKTGMRTGFTKDDVMKLYRLSMDILNRRN